MKTVVLSYSNWNNFSNSSILNEGVIKELAEMAESSNSENDFRKNLKEYFMKNNPEYVENQKFIDETVKEFYKKENEDKSWLEVSALMVKNDYKVKTVKNEVAHYELDVPKIIAELKKTYILIKKNTK